MTSFRLKVVLTRERLGEVVASRRGRMGGRYRSIRRRGAACPQNPQETQNPLFFYL